MHLSLVSGLVLMVLYDQVLPAMTHLQVGHVHIENFKMQREKRSLIIKGGQALVKKVGQGYKWLRGYFTRQTLLKGAEFLGNTKGANIYEKPGGRVKMLKDFDSVHPSNVRIFKKPGGVFGEVGQVGNREIRWSTESGLRELYLSNPGKKGNGLPDVIYYTGK